MLSFKATGKIEKELKSLQEALVESYNELQLLGDAEKTYLKRLAFISSVGASTRIENAVLTDHQIQWIDTTLNEDGKTTSSESRKAFILEKLSDKLSKDQERSLEEVMGCREVLSIIYGQGKELFPLTESTLRGIHGSLLRYYPAASHYLGAYKTNLNQVVSKNHDTGEQITVLEPAAPGVITEMAMTELVQWYNQTIQTCTWPLLVASEFVFRFLAIHPFQDGNGRLGRALFLLGLLQSGDKYLSGVAPYLAIDRHIEQNRPRYYAVLHQCSGGKYYEDPARYDMEPVVWFFLKVVQDALKDVTHYRKRYADMQKLSESATIVLNLFKDSPEKRLKVSDLMEESGLPRRTVNNALKTLKVLGFLQMLGQGAGARYQLVF
jgi:Fic family protein